MLLSRFCEVVVGDLCIHLRKDATYKGVPLLPTSPLTNFDASCVTAPDVGVCILGHHNLLLKCFLTLLPPA